MAKRPSTVVGVGSPRSLRVDRTSIETSKLTSEFSLKEYTENERGFLFHVIWSENKYVFTESREREENVEIIP